MTPVRIAFCIFTGIFFRAQGEVVYLLDNDLGTRDLDDGLPDTLHFKLRSQGRDLEMTLRENTHLGAYAPVYTLSLDAAGNLVPVISETVQDRSVRYYQDLQNRGFFSATCITGQSVPCVRALTGNLVIDGQEHSLQPLRDPDEKRGFTNQYVPHKLEKIVRKRTDDIQDSDYLEIPGYEDDELEISETVPVDEQTRGIWNNLLRRKMDYALRSKRAITAHGVEILFITDYEVYRKFRAMSNDDDSTRQSILHYYTHILNGVDLMYASIQENDFSLYITVSAFFMSTVPETSPWTQGLGRGKTLYDTISQFKEWRKRQLNRLPSHDHASLLTGAADTNGVVGMAYLYGMCSEYSVSVNKEMDFFQTSATVAHELGHNLGARHDESRNNCPASDIYLMTPYVAHIEENSSTMNPWKFSSCSIKYFRRFLQSLGSNSCLRNRGTVWNDDEWSIHKASLPGKLYSLEQQCALAHGADAVFCAQNNANTETICRGLGCRFHGDDCLNYVAAHGTPCGDNKHCFRGKCITIGDEDDTPGEEDNARIEEFHCVDKGVGGTPCIVLRSIAETALCNNNFYDCCETCMTSCNGDLDVGEQTCGRLIKNHGKAFVCRAFTRNCCGTCGS